MTRIALLADIHGNLPALERVVADMRQFAPDHVVVAGDSVNWGPFSAEVLQLIYDNRWTVIRGNNEYYVINAKPPRKPDSWAAYTLLDWLHDQLGEWHHLIAGQPDDVTLLYPDAPDVHLCHGIPGDCWTGIYAPEFDSDATVSGWLATSQAKTVFCGHTHIPLNRRVGEYHIINPGSVGVPLLGEAVSSYMILDGSADGWQVTHQRTLPIDPAPMFAAWERLRFVERCGVTATMVMEEFKRFRLVIHPFNTWMRQSYPDTPATHAHGAEFLALDISHYTPKQYLQPGTRQYLDG